MQSNCLGMNNRLIIAVAGAGKTTHICELALETVNNGQKRVLLVSYTNMGVEAIKNKLKEINNGVEHRDIEVKTWFSFVVNECLKPYQSYLFDINQVKGITFTKQNERNRYLQQGTPERYLNKIDLLYSDYITEAVAYINSRLGNVIIKRLEEKYEAIFIDEVQDLAGWDIEIIYKLLESKIITISVGDPLQNTFKTNHLNKNKKKSGKDIIYAFVKYEEKKLVDISYMNESKRCNKKICEFVKRMCNNQIDITSTLECESEDEGVFILLEKELEAYQEKYSAQVLRYNQKAKINKNINPINYGISKGLTFNRIIIYPNGPFKDYLTKGKMFTSISKYYIAVTRARKSVCFIFEKLPKLFDYDLERIEVDGLHGKITLYKLKI